MGCSSQFQGQPQHRRDHHAGPSIFRLPVAIERSIFHCKNDWNWEWDGRRAQQRAGLFKCISVLRAVLFKPWRSWRATQIASRASDHPTHRRARGLSAPGLHLTPNIRLLSEISFPISECEEDCTHLQFFNQQTVWPALEDHRSMLPPVARSHSGCQDGCLFVGCSPRLGCCLSATLVLELELALFLRHCAAAGNLEGSLWLTCLDLAPTLVRVWRTAPPTQSPFETLGYLQSRLLTHTFKIG